MNVTEQNAAATGGERRIELCEPGRRRLLAVPDERPAGAYPRLIPFSVALRTLISPATASRPRASSGVPRLRSESHRLLPYPTSKPQRWRGSPREVAGLGNLLDHGRDIDSDRVDLTVAVQIPAPFSSRCTSSGLRSRRTPIPGELVDLDRAAADVPVGHQLGP